MNSAHSSRHAAGPVFVDASGRRLRHVLRAGWALLAGVALYAVVVVTAALGGPSLDAPFLPQGPVDAQVSPDGQQSDPTRTPSATPSSTGEPSDVTSSSSPTASPELTVGRDSADESSDVQAVASTTRPTAAAPTSTTASPTSQPSPTPSESPRGKSDTAPGATNRPTPTQKP